MPSFFQRLFNEPPPELAYEISEGGIAMVRTASPNHVSFHPFSAGVIQPSPLHDNVLSADLLLAGVRAITPATASRKRRRAVILLPDASARVSVLDFEQLPDKEEDRDALVRFRMKKSVPFEVETAALSYWRQPDLDGKQSIVAAVAPLEIIARYEAPFRSQNIQPGFVTLSFLAAMELAPVSTTITMFAKLSARSLTVLVLRQGVIQLIRSIEMESRSLAEIAGDLFPTVVYTEDHFGIRAAELLICGFDALEAEAVPYLQTSLELPVRVLSTRDSGLAGYIGASAAIPRQAAA